MTHQTRRIERDAEHGAERHDAQDMPHKYDEIRRIMHDALSFSFGYVSTFLSFLFGRGWFTFTVLLFFFLRLLSNASERLQ